MSTTKQLLESEIHILNDEKNAQNGFCQKLPYICTLTTIGLALSALAIYKHIKTSRNTHNKQRN